MTEIAYQIHSFDEPYNGHVIENPTGDENAIYYTFTNGERNFLQAHKPWVPWYEPVYATDTDVIESHIESLV